MLATISFGVPEVLATASAITEPVPVTVSVARRSRPANLTLPVLLLTAALPVTTAVAPEQSI